jgi:hypothetical protein
MARRVETARLVDLGYQEAGSTDRDLTHARSLRDIRSKGSDDGRPLPLPRV